jgi:DNA-binding CsgD family transcriptional regulator
MMQALQFDAAAAFAPRARAMPSPLLAYKGPERRSSSSLSTRLLALMLDEIDYGMLLTEGTHVLHANHAAQAELDAGHPLKVASGVLRVDDPLDLARLQEALVGAKRGLRKLVPMGTGARRVNLAVVPLGLGGTGATLVMMGKRQVCERLSVQWFARSHALTPAETRVLEGLCEGMEPREVATLHQVGLATVRTQIGNIRAKTGASSIRSLVRQVAVLPPMVSSLRVI